MVKEWKCGGGRWIQQNGSGHIDARCCGSIWRKGGKHEGRAHDRCCIQLVLRGVFSLQVSVQGRREKKTQGKTEITTNNKWCATHSGGRLVTREMRELETSREVGGGGQSIKNWEENRESIGNVQRLDDEILVRTKFFFKEKILNLPYGSWTKHCLFPFYFYLFFFLVGSIFHFAK